MDNVTKHTRPASPRLILPNPYQADVRVQVVEACDNSPPQRLMGRGRSPARAQENLARPQGALQRSNSPGRILLPARPAPATPGDYLFGTRAPPAPPNNETVPLVMPVPRAAPTRLLPQPLRLWRRDDVPPPPGIRASALIAELNREHTAPLEDAQEIWEMVHGLALLRAEFADDRPWVSGPQDISLLGNLTAMQTFRACEEAHIREFLLTCGEMAGIACATVREISPYVEDVPRAMGALRRVFLSIARDLGELRLAAELRQNRLGTMRPNPRVALKPREATWAQNPIFPHAPLHWTQPGRTTAIAEHFGDQAAGLDELRSMAEVMRLVLEHVACAIRTAYPRPKPIWPNTHAL